MKKHIFRNLFSVATLCAAVFTKRNMADSCIIYDSKDLAGFGERAAI